MSLDGFLVVWHPFTANEVVEFGNSSKPWTLAFPEKATLAARSRLTVVPKYKLNATSIAKYDGRVLGGIQLELFDKEGEGWIMDAMMASETLKHGAQAGKSKAQPVGDHTAISAISMLCLGDEFYGLQIKDQGGKVIYENKWFTPAFEGAAWIEKKLEPGRRIIGMVCNNEGPFLQRIGFVVQRCKA